MKRSLSILVVVFLCAPLSRAQRTSFGESQIAASFTATFSHVGGELSYGQYLIRGFWLTELGYHNRIERDIPSGETIYYPRVQLRGGYMYRLLSNYPRSLNFYGGGDAFIGVELFDVYRTLSESTRQAYYYNGFHDYQFIYGVAPRLELECFLAPSVASLLRVRVPLCFGTPFPTLGWEVGIGAKVNF